MRNSKTLLCISLTFTLISLAIYLAPLPSVIPLTTSQVNDIAMALFGGFFVGSISEWIHYKREVEICDNTFFECMAQLLNALANLGELSDTKSTNQLFVDYFDARDGISILGDNQLDDARKKLANTLHANSAEFVQYSADRKEAELRMLAEQYLDIAPHFPYMKNEAKGFDYEIALKYANQYDFICKYSQKAIATNCLVCLLRSIWQLVREHSDEFGQTRLLCNNANDASPAEALRAVIELNEVFFSISTPPGNEAVRNHYAAQLLKAFKCATNKSNWPDKAKVPDESWWF